MIIYISETIKNLPVNSLMLYAKDRRNILLRQKNTNTRLGVLFFVAMVKEKCPCWAFYFYFVRKPNSIINGNIRDSKSG